MPRFSAAGASRSDPLPPSVFRVDPHGGAPLYVQLSEQIKRAVAVGSLLPGERLPTVKALALELTINPNTVARVYRDLERQGVISTAAGRGSFVNDAGTVGQAQRAAHDVAERAIDGAIREVKSLGLTRDDVAKLASGAIAKHFGETKS